MTRSVHPLAELLVVITLIVMVIIATLTVLNARVPLLNIAVPIFENPLTAPVADSATSASKPKPE